MPGPAPAPRLLAPLTLAVLAACSSSSDPLYHPPPVSGDVALTRFADCSALEQAIEDTEVLEMRSQLEMAREGYFWPMGIDRGGGPVPANAGNAAGPSAYTTTNAQVAGVDEADFVQNDGTRIFVLSGDTLYLASSWPPEALALVSQVQIEGWPR
jgi:uncharacterized secreted protein with C-terminal beta-propeller domain